MLDINQENVLRDLEIIRNKLDTATLEQCVETLQILIQSMFFLKEKKPADITDEEWDDYSRIRFNLGSHFVNVIDLYNERLTRLINENNQRLFNDMVDINEIRNVTGVREQNENEQNRLPYDTPESISDSIDSFNFPLTPNTNNDDGIPQHHTTYPYNSPRIRRSNSNLQVNGNFSLDESAINRSNTEPANITKSSAVSSPVSSYNNELLINNGINSVPSFNETDGVPSFNESDYRHTMSFASQSLMTSISSFPEEENGDSIYTETSFIIGQYVCKKEFKAKEDFQIDLQLNDTLTVNQFTGKYILGRNCRSNHEGLFPIYYIESLEHNYTFYLCKEEMEFASVNDEIFLLGENDGDYYPGYNITKGEQGMFCKSKLEPIEMDDNRRNSYEYLYGDNIVRNNSKGSIKTSGTISTINTIPDDRGLVDPLLPTTTTNPQSELIDKLSKKLSINEDKQIDQSIVEKLLDYYKTLPELQGNDPFDKSKDNNLYLMRDAIKKFQEFRIEDKKGLEWDESFKKEKEHFISPSIFENTETKNKKWESNRYRCQELVDTEKSYCETMKIMVEKFMKPLEAAAETENEMLNKVQISLIFKNIPAIYEFSHKLHEELAEAFTHYDEEGPIPIAQVFLDKFSDWQLYIKYVEDYQSASNTLINLKRTPQTERFNRFMAQCQRSKECKQSHLKDLIVLPVQRFLKYHTIFEGIKKDSDPRDKESYSLLDTVENYVYEIGEIMNNAKKIQENINKMFSLEQIIMNYPIDLISYTQRTYIGEWNISEVIKNKQRKLYLFSDTVLFATILNKKKGKRYLYAYEKRVDILDYNVIKSTSSANKKIIKFVETERCKNKKKSLKSGRSHSHSLLGFSLNNHISDTSITKSLIFFDNEDACNEFVKKYNEQRDNLLN